MGEENKAAPGRRVSRRRFLEALGIGTAGALVGGGAALASGANKPAVGADAASAHAAAYRSDRFGRMFRQPAFAAPTPDVVAALNELGRPGGLLDAADALEAGPAQLITNPALSVNNPDNPMHPAGATFVGQFIDHDITFDLSSQLGTPMAPEAAVNGRSPAMDLDSVYGAGPAASPQLYDSRNRAKLLVESGGRFEDLPRSAAGTALIGDPRNDETVVIAGLHAAFLLFHNHVVDRVRAAGAGDADVFGQARRLVTWHYQWMVLHEFLPLFVGPAMVDDVLSHGPRHYKAAQGLPFIPVEFQGAAYRFGHSMVRPSYRANLAGDRGKPFFGLIFDPAQSGKPDPEDLSGGSRAPRRFVGWQTFFDFGDGEVKHNKRIDTKISTPLFNLPLGSIASHDAPTSLSQRTLLRHLTWQLPSGQRIAQAMNAPQLSPADLDELKPLGAGLVNSTPLWYYILKEAELMEYGLHLGPVGGRIVAEVLIGLMRSDPGSFLSAEPGWRPTLPSRFGENEFRMVDMLALAGVDPKSRGQ